MKKILLSLLLVSAFFAMNNCSTDFDMYSEYEDVTIVYGLLDISDDTSWVKITKAFTGPGNALLIAQNPDSSNFPYKLDVTLNGVKNGADLTPIQLDTIMIHNKDLTDTVINNDGDTLFLNPFYSPDQLMYFTTEIFDEDAEYTLNIKKDDETITANTGLVGNFSIIKPNSRFAFSQDLDGVIEWYSAKNGIEHEVTLSFYYLEYLSGYPDTIRKSFSWNVGSKKAKDESGSDKLELTYSGARFYSLLVNEVEPIPNVERWADSVYITIAAGSQELTTYLDINSGAGSLLEEIPQYTNISGGSGIFASRHTIVKPVRLSTLTELTIIQDYDLGFKTKSK